MTQGTGTLDGKVIVITGAARGLGQAYAIAFAASGAQVVAADVGDCAETVALATADGGSCIGLAADVTDAEAVEAMAAAAVDAFGGIDALINNAALYGALHGGRFDSIDEGEWDAAMNVNVKGIWYCCRAVVPRLRERGGGSIVNITSISGLRASTLRVAYGTSKAGLMHLTKQQAAELGEVGIRVNAVSPGPVDTAMAKAVHSPEIRADYHDAIPLNRYGLEREIADAILFLCSDRANYITGQILAVDGGFDAVGIGLTSLRDDP